MNWPTVKLGDLFQVTSGGTPSRSIPEYYENGDIPWIKTGDLHNRYVEQASEYITPAGLNSSSTRLYPVGTVLVAMYGATIGACSTLKIPACTNQACAAFTPNEKVDIDYLYYFLKHSKPVFVNAGSGGAQPNISAGYLKNYEIPLPPLTEQKRIAAILDKADAIRRKRQQAIELADDFLRAVFLEMFGDPVANSKGWEIKPLKSLTNKIGSGSTPRGGSESYQTQGISLIRSLNIHDNEFRVKDLAFIDDVQADRLSNVIVEENDVLLNITGASVCRCTIVPANILPARVNQHVCIIRTNGDVSSSYLMHMLISQPYKQMLLKMSGAGATREALTKLQIESLSVPIPPVSLQREFEAIMCKVNSMIENSERFSNEVFFDSLSQKAFSGQL